MNTWITEEQKENVKKLVKFLELMQLNHIPNFDLNKDFDQSDWNYCIFGTFIKYYGLYVDYIHTTRCEDAQERFGFSRDFLDKIFFCDDYNDTVLDTDYEYYANRALESLKQEGYC